MGLYNSLLIIIDTFIQENILLPMVFYYLIFLLIIGCLWILDGYLRAILNFEMSMMFVLNFIFETVYFIMYLHMA